MISSSSVRAPIGLDRCGGGFLFAKPLQQQEEEEGRRRDPEGP